MKNGNVLKQLWGSTITTMGKYWNNYGIVLKQIWERTKYCMGL